MAVRFSLALLCVLLLVPAAARAAVTFGATCGLAPDGERHARRAAATRSSALRQRPSTACWCAGHCGRNGAAVAVAAGRADTRARHAGRWTTDGHAIRRACACPSARATSIGLRDQFGTHAAAPSTARRCSSPASSSPTPTPTATATRPRTRARPRRPARRALPRGHRADDVRARLRRRRSGHAVRRDRGQPRAERRRRRDRQRRHPLRGAVRAHRGDRPPAPPAPPCAARCRAIAPGASGVLTIVLAGTAEGASFHHAVSVTTTSTDPTPGDHSASVDTLVTGASVPGAAAHPRGRGMRQRELRRARRRRALGQQLRRPHVRPPGARPAARARRQRLPVRRRGRRRARRRRRRRHALGRRRPRPALRRRGQGSPARRGQGRRAARRHRQRRSSSPAPAATACGAAPATTSSRRATARAT